MSTRTAAGQFKGQFKGASTHVACGVVMDIAAFKVSHSVGIDEDATALPAARARSSSIHRGNGGNVTEGSKCELPPHNTAHTQGTRSNSAGPWRNCHRRFKMQTLTLCDAKITSTRTAAGQFKVVQWGYGGIVTEGSKCKDSHAATAPKSRARAQQSVSSRGAMERDMRGFDSAQKLT